MNKIGSPGLPWGFEIRIVGREGEELPAGEPGELLIRGEGMMQGYYKDPVGTLAALDSELWLHTGDLGELDSEKRLKILGRRKEVIVGASGLNVYPEDV